MPYTCDFPWQRPLRGAVIKQVQGDRCDLTWTEGSRCTAAPSQPQPSQAPSLLRSWSRGGLRSTGDPLGAGTVCPVTQALLTGSVLGDLPLQGILV